MPDLLHEYWENDGQGEFCPVREHADKIRLGLTPGAKLVFSLYAASWNEAMQLYQERLGYGDYKPVEGVPDHIYTEDGKAEQERYLRVRNISR